MAVLYLSTPERGAVMRAALGHAFPDLPFFDGIAPDPLAVTYAITWTCPPDLFAKHPNLRVLISVGAGVDQLDLAHIPPDVAVVRMLEPSLPEQMAEYVTMATLALHRGLPAYIAQQREGHWKAGRNRPASECRVGIMGLGQLGMAVANALRPFGFPFAGWSRGPKTGIDSYTDLDAFLARTDLLICLLPLTPDTEGLLDARLFARLPHGAQIVHAGRGRQLVARDLIAALDDGQLSGAVLDVTDPEPLPSDHPLWRHPAVIITPHIACQTRATDAAEHVISVIRAERLGQNLPGLVDRSRGY